MQEVENSDLSAEERAQRLQPPAPLVSTITANAIVELHRRTTNGPSGDASGNNTGDDYYRDLAVTVRYNQARLNEAMNRPDLAEAIYKSILLQHPTYVDCNSLSFHLIHDMVEDSDGFLLFSRLYAIGMHCSRSWPIT